jgi:hypothetical protein
MKFKTLSTVASDWRSTPLTDGERDTNVAFRARVIRKPARWRGGTHDA